MSKVLLDDINDELLKISNFNFESEEPEFSSLSLSEPNLYIWRIEKSSLKKWPKENYGIFYEGDSFLVLKIENDNKIYAHVWIGNSSTQDEISFVICKVMQLDNFLENKCTIYYECQSKESEKFLSYFKIFFYEKGGVDADLEAKNQNKSIIKLFVVHGSGSNVKVVQIPINKKKIKSSDAYLLDEGLNVYIYIGASSNCFEKFKLSALAQKIKEKRENQVTIIEVDEKGTNDNDIKYKKIFDEMLEKFEENIDEVKSEDKKEENKENKENLIRKMFKLSDESGKLSLNDGKENLNSGDVFLIDKDDTIFLYIGKGVSKNEKRFSRYYAKNYIIKQRNNAKLPIVVVNEENLANDSNKIF